MNPLDKPVDVGNNAANPPPPTHKFLCRSVAEALSECQRELKVRDRCYDRWIDDGKLSQVEATDRMERLQMACHVLAIVNDLGCYAELLGMLDARNEALKNRVTSIAPPAP